MALTVPTPFTYMYDLHPGFWECERNCIHEKVNLHMCKYTPHVNIHLVRPGVYLHICILFTDM